MRDKISSLSKNEDFKFLLNGKKINNKYLTIFFKKLSNKNNKNLNISFVAQKKIGNAVKRNKIKSLIFGISGQDGSYLSHLLLSKKNEVYGTTRNNNKKNLKNLVH